MTVRSTRTKVYLMNDATQMVDGPETTDEHDAAELDSDEIVDTDESWAAWCAWQARGSK